MQRNRRDREDQGQSQGIILLFFGGERGLYPEGNTGTAGEGHSLSKYDWASREINSISMTIMNESSISFLFTI
jgi:hypothetical protein